MRCPYCEHPGTQVLETRDADEAVRRRRACPECAQRFTTYERAGALTLTVRKRDGRREPFDRDKLLRGLVRAAAKRPVALEALELLADDVGERLRAEGGELDAGRIGELALGGLRALDGVAYVRFASVYRRFEDAREFTAELERLELEQAGGAGAATLDTSDRDEMMRSYPQRAGNAATDVRKHR